MRVIRCPNCEEPLPWTARFCAKCGFTLSIPQQPPEVEDENLVAPTVKILDRSAAHKAPGFYATDAVGSESTQHIARPGTVTPVEDRPGNSFLDIDTPPLTQKYDEQQEDDDDYEMPRPATWNKAVTYKTPRVIPAPVTPLPLQEVSHKGPRRIPTNLLSWVSVLALLGLLLGGIFGVMISFGRGLLTQPSHAHGMLSLQVAPSTVAFGGTVALRGSNFSAFTRVGLTRDTDIPVVDTGGESIIHTDFSGSFSDTVIVDPTWGAGSHIIRAEDATLHKSATFTVIVTGQSTSLRPARLVFSTYTIDLGTGDQATNGIQAITLSNAGGGQISWQATVTQPWLLISPPGGTFSSGQNMQVMVAAERSNLRTGSYSGRVIFTSNTGQSGLPVKMKVTPLQPGHDAVLQLTPPVLSFSGADGGANPPGQVVTVSNPGVQSLQWSASSAAIDGSNWLSVYPQSGTVAKGASQPVTISPKIGALLPGFYKSWITFSAQGSAVKDSPQTVYISLTIVPQCAIQVSPGDLTFTSVFPQSQPAPKVVSVGMTQECSNSLHWSATAITNQGGRWLGIGTTTGMTPAYPSVYVSAGDLAPGTYTGAVVFSSSSGTQTIPVTYIVGLPATPNMATAPAMLSFRGVKNLPAPASQEVSVTNSGGGTLNWHAAVTTAVGGTWLSVSPASGSLAPNQSATITVTATLLTTLIPGNYTGTIMINGTDGAGRTAAGSPQSIPVAFVVQAPCAIAATTPALTFQGVVGQPAPAAQSVTITASGACANSLNWTATAATKTPAGGTWLTTTPVAGTVSLKAASSTLVGVVVAGLTAGTYTGTVTITAVDSVTKRPAGKPQAIMVTLTIQPTCTLQAPPVATTAFSSEVGLNPTTQSFTIGVIGSCAGPVTITPTVTMGSGTGWLGVSPASASIASGSSATFTVTVTSAALAAGSYTGSISLAAVNGGIAITGSPQLVAVTLNVLTAPVLTAGPGPLSFNVAGGTSSQQIKIGNAGGEPLNWTATLATSAPSFISLSPAAGLNLLGGTTTAIGVDVDATGLTGGSSYTASVTVSAIDPITGNAVAGSPATIPITINIAPPQMTLSPAGLAFTTTAGTNPAAQTISIQNTGGNTLSWTIGAPSASWLTVTPASGSDAAGGSSTVTFTVNVTGLSAGAYTATVVITPSPGTAVTVTVTLAVN